MGAAEANFCSVARWGPRGPQLWETPICSRSSQAWAEGRRPRACSAGGPVSPPPASPTAPRAVCLEKKADQFVFIQSHLRSHFGEMKREKPASRARPAGCSPVPGGALGGGAVPLPHPPSHPLPSPTAPFPPPPSHLPLVSTLPPLSFTPPPFCFPLPPTPAVPQTLSPASRPGRAHLHGRHTRGPSAEAQLNAGGRGGARN